MKKILLYIGIMLTIFSCSPDEIPSIGDKVDRKAQIIGTWTVSKFVQIDVPAQAKSFPTFAAEKDLTNIFEGHPYTDFKITLKQDGTFTTELGTSYVNMLSDGTWNFDNDEYPSAIILKKGEQEQKVSIASFADIYENTLKLKEERKNSTTDKVQIIYVYTLKR